MLNTETNKTITYLSKSEFQIPTHFLSQNNKY